MIEKYQALHIEILLHAGAINVMRPKKEEDKRRQVAKRI